MKLKFFLRGFGIGIALTAIILSMWHTSEKNIMTNQEIVEQAKKLGMIDPKELDTAEIVTPVPTDKVIPTEEVVVTSTPKTKPQNKETAKPKETKKPVVEQDVVSITIKDGMWSEKICQKLQELGVVKNAREFNEYLCENGYETKIRQGTYKIRKGSTYKEIAEDLLK